MNAATCWIQGSVNSAKAGLQPPLTRSTWHPCVGSNLKKKQHTSSPPHSMLLPRIHYPPAEWPFKNMNHISLPCLKTLNVLPKPLEQNFNFPPMACSALHDGTPASFSSLITLPHSHFLSSCRMSVHSLCSCCSLRLKNTAIQFGVQMSPSFWVRILFPKWPYSYCPPLTLSTILPVLFS